MILKCLDFVKNVVLYNKEKLIIVDNVMCVSISMIIIAHGLRNVLVEEI